MLKVLNAVSKQVHVFLFLNQTEERSSATFALILQAETVMSELWKNVTVFLRGSSVGEGGGGGVVVSRLLVAEHPGEAVVADALPGLLAATVLASGVGHAVLAPRAGPCGEAQAFSGLVAESGGGVAS